MAEETNSEGTDSETPKLRNTYPTAIAGNEIAKTVSGQILVLDGQLLADLERSQRQLAEYYREQLHWTKRGASFAIVLSGLSVAVVSITAWILWQIFGVYNGQRKIMSAQAAIMMNQAGISRDQVDAANLSNRLLELETVANVGIIQSLPAVDGHALLTFKNTGKTVAKNVEVKVAYTPAVNPPNDFDPFVDARNTLANLVNAQKQFIQQARREEALGIKRAKAIREAKNRKLTQERIRRSFEERIKLAQQTIKDLERRPFGRTYSDSIGELPADGSIDFPLDFHLGEEWLNAPGHFAYAFGTFRYEDQLGQIHQNLRFCYRYGGNGSVASCLRFQPSDSEINNLTVQR
jgi:hypothetical protein